MPTVTCMSRCCQQPKGGLRDKPGKPPDQYHTCYCLSGLSSAQHCSNLVLGPPTNMLKAADPMCNIVEEKLAAARKYFSARPLVPAAGAEAGSQASDMEM